MSRIASIERYREKTLDHAALVASLSAARLDEFGKLGELVDRKDAQLVDRIHELAFNGRKLIELVDRERFSSIQYADRTSVFCGQEDKSDPEDWPIAMMSLRQVCGRIIHSDHFEVERTHVPDQEGNLSKGKASWAFRVASDREPPGTTIFVYLEFFLSELMVFDEHLARDLHLFHLRSGAGTSAT